MPVLPAMAGSRSIGLTKPMPPRVLLESEGATIVLLSRPGESAAFRITAPLRRQG